MSNVPRLYRKKPVVIEALQLRRDTWDAMRKFAAITIPEGEPAVDSLYLSVPPRQGDGVQVTKESVYLAIPTLEGTMVAKEGDYIIRGIAGELYPCREDIFVATYELVEDSPWDDLENVP